MQLRSLAKSVIVRSSDLFRHQLSGAALLPGYRGGCGAGACGNRSRCCAALGQAEIMAAFHRKLRSGAIRPAAYSALVVQLKTHITAGAFQWLGQDEETLLRVRRVYEGLPGSVYLRGADAIHLGTAAEAGFRIVYSNDSHLLAAARHFGIEGKNVIPDLHQRKIRNVSSDPHLPTPISHMRSPLIKASPGPHN
jgi:hypothetical protein